MGSSPRRLYGSSGRRSTLIRLSSQALACAREGAARLGCGSGGLTQEPGPDLQSAEAGPLQSLNHVALPLPILLHRAARGFAGGEEELHGVTADLTDLVTELEPVDFLHLADHDAVLFAAAARWVRRGHDPLRILVPRRLLGRVPDDVPGRSIHLGVRALLPDIAADAPQLVILAHASPMRGRAPWPSARRRGEKSW